MAQVGQTAILKCFCGKDSVTFFSWYQQKLGSKPVIISSRMRHNTEASVSPSFKGRFEVESTERNNHLSISNLLLSDSAVYYCGILEFNLLQFGEGTFLHVRICEVRGKISANSSDEGVYYCALASCGEIVLGNGTQVQLSRSKAQPQLLCGFSAALAVSILLLFALAFTACTLKKQTCSVCKGRVISEMASQETDDLHYAAVGLKRSSEHDLDEEEYQCQKSVCVYSKIKTNK
uniref:Ig-like domain-containing protein n=1 Tax=Tetraodon nigroviridis TaxID=99883 RepID=H3C0H9_TETNG